MKIMKYLLFVLAASVAFAQEPQPIKTEISGNRAMRVLIFHWKAVALEGQRQALVSQLQTLNAQIQAGLKAACDEKNISQCRVTEIGDETIIVEAVKPAEPAKPTEPAKPPVPSSTK